MKNNYFFFILTLLITGLLFQGFQCGSSDFTAAKMKEQKKDYAEAAKYYEKEVQTNPLNQEAWVRLGRIRGEELKDYEGMTAAFREAEKISPQYKTEIYAYRFTAWAQHLNEGVALIKRASADSQQFYDQAINEYMKSVTVWPDTSLTYFFLAQAYQGKGDIENAIKSQKKVWDLDRDIDAYKRVGRLYIQQGLEKKEQFRSANTDGLRMQKNLQDIDKGSHKTDVTRAFGEPDSKKKDKKNNKKEDWIYNQYGLTLTLESEMVIGKKIDKKNDFKIDSTKYYDAVIKFNNAVEVFEAIKKTDPKDNENLNLLLQAYYEANRIKEATDAFKLAVENDPGNKMNHYILGLLYRMVDNYDKAIEEFNEAVQIDPDFNDAYYDLGATYYNWGVKIKKAEQEKGDESKSYKTKFESALPWMIKVTETKIKTAQEAASKTGQDWHTQLRLEDARIWDTIGTIYALLGKAEEAGKALDEADAIRKTAR
jgi:tetratricopeptide (TPR) repeat protein